MKKLTISAIFLAIFLATSLCHAGALLTYPKFQAWTDNGKLCAGCKLYTYYPTTDTPKATYTDIDTTTPSANPITLNARGEATIYLVGAYRLVLKTSTGTQVWVQDNVRGWGGSGGGGGSGDCVYATDYMCDLGNATTAIAGTNQCLVINDVCTLTQNVTLPTGSEVIFLSQGGVNLSIYSLTFWKPPRAGPWQIFQGTGLVHMGNGEVFADWWGSTSAAISKAWNAITDGTVRLTPAGTYTGNLTLTSSTAGGKKLEGQGACISGGNFVSNNSKQITINDLKVDGHGEINGCWSCVFNNVQNESGCGAFAGSTKQSTRYMLITDGNDSAGFGMWWNTFNNCSAHGLILAPGLNGSTTNNGINSNQWNSCRYQGALTSGTGLSDDTDNASIRIAVIGTDTEVNTQSNSFNGSDLSYSRWLVKNDNPEWEVYVSGGYAEQYNFTHRGPVEFENTYLYTSLTTAGDNDTIFTPDSLFSSSARGTTGLSLYPSIDLFSNGWFGNLRTYAATSYGSAWLPEGLSSTTWGSTCGNDTAADGSTIAMVEDKRSGNPYGKVLHITGPSSGTCSVRFHGGGACTAMNTYGFPSASILMKGTLTSNVIGYSNKGTHQYNFLHGSQSTAKYELLAGSLGGVGAADGNDTPYVELILSPGDDVYLAGISMGRGKSLVSQPTQKFFRSEGFSGNGPPTTGVWYAGDMIWNNATATWYGGGGTVQGHPAGWRCTVAGTFDDGNATHYPTFQRFGQTGTRVITANDLTSTKSHQIGEIAETDNGTVRKVWISFGDNTTTDWVQLSN